MDTWINAQALHDIGLKQIKTGLDNVKKAYEIMERVNGEEDSKTIKKETVDADIRTD